MFRVVVSCVEDPNAKGKDRNGRSCALLIRVNPPSARAARGADEDDVRTIVVAYLKEYCKELDTPLVDVICRMEQARNPLYLW
jgi:hypothetical protein